MTTAVDRARRRLLAAIADPSTPEQSIDRFRRLLVARIHEAAARPAVAGGAR